MIPPPPSAADSAAGRGVSRRHEHRVADFFFCLRGRPCHLLAVAGTGALGSPAGGEPAVLRMGDGWYLPFLGFGILSTYAAARWMQAHADRDAAALAAAGAELSREERKARRAAGKRIRRRALILCLVLNFAVLAVLKYTGFLLCPSPEASGDCSAPGISGRPPCCSRSVSPSTPSGLPPMS